MSSGNGWRTVKKGSEVLGMGEVVVVWLGTIWKVWEENKPKTNGELTHVTRE